MNVISAKEKFDTSTPQGKLMLTVFQAFAEFERDIIVQRTKEGLKSARARGRVGGRPKKSDKKIQLTSKGKVTNGYYCINKVGAVTNPKKIS